MKDYLPQDINYDRDCVIWILENYQSLSSGDWPGSKPSGYTELPAHTQRGFLRAPFENPVLIAAEVMIRVRRCGMDGFLVEERYVKLKTEEEIARQRHLSIDEIIRCINKVIWYCASGKIPRWKDTKKRKGRSYREWRRDGRIY